MELETELSEVRASRAEEFYWDAGGPIKAPCDNCTISSDRIWSKDCAAPFHDATGCLANLSRSVQVATS
jgi:hypothetical protein